MRINKLIIRMTLTLLLVGCSATVQADSSAKQFMQGVDAFQQGGFQEAVAKFLPIAESGVENGRLFYNLGNAYLKAGDLGHAIYWYERAKTFMPRNADLSYNLDYARSLRVDDQPTDSSILTEILFFWQDILAARTIQWLVIGANLMLWLGLGLLQLRPGACFKSMTFTGLIILLALTPTALFQLYRATMAPQAIILPETAPVRSGRSDRATELFILHAGSRVDVLEQTRGYTKITFGKNMFGWIDQKDLGVL